jgi:phosphoglycerol transferase MdoB-like AlkP superfamily enzyme
MTIRVLPRLSRFVAVCVLLDVILFTALRLVFWAANHVPGDPLPGEVLAKSLYIGMKFDLRLALLMNLPVLALAWPRQVNVFDTVRGRRLWTGYLVWANISALLFYLVDFGHYAYLQTRLDFTAVRFLYNPLISLQMVWETYPVVWGALGLVLAATAMGYALSRLAARMSAPKTVPLGRWQKAAMITTIVLVFAAGVYGKFSHYPLRWSDAFFSTHPFSSSLALNPITYFFDTMKNRETSYDEERTRQYYGLMSEYLGVTDPDEGSLDYSRREGAKDNTAKRPNVIIVFLESFGYYKTGLSGNPLDPTPKFDALARDSLLFSRFYVPSTGTARSVFTAITGLPDVETNKTSSRNPMIVRQHTIISAFKDYEKYYFLGGSANWANIRGLLSHNISDLRIYEEGSYSAPRVDVWGISDLHLFEEANKVLKDAEEPFFAIIQTSGSHRPYTIPDDNRGFKTVEVDEEEAGKYGFISGKEFNSFRFLDHAIGHFVEAAGREEYFRDTVFVFFGDHGIVGNAQHMSKAENRLLLTAYHVPLVIYAPGLVPGGRVMDNPAGEADVLPTIAGLTSTPYLNTTLGRDLLDSRFDGSRHAFTIANQSRLPEIGLIGSGFYFLMNADGSGRRLHDISSGSPREDVQDRHPERAALMERLCMGMYETARYMRYHNSPN